MPFGSEELLLMGTRDPHKTAILEGGCCKCCCMFLLVLDVALDTFPAGSFRDP